MRINSTSSNDLALTGNHFSSWTNYYRDSILNIRVSCLANTNYSSIVNSNICLNNTPVIQNESIGNYQINCL